MSEVTVTKKQMDGIKLIKGENHYKLSDILKRNAEGFEWNFSNFYNPKEENPRNELNTMTPEQIVLAWHGFAKVEPNYVSFDKAFKALKGGKNITIHYEDGEKDEIFLEDLLEDFIEVSISNLLNGKYTIEGE